jgi:hypothetical protein
VNYVSVVPEAGLGCGGRGFGGRIIIGVAASRFGRFYLAAHYCRFSVVLEQPVV